MVLGARVWGLLVPDMSETLENGTNQTPQQHCRAVTDT